MADDNQQDEEVYAVCSNEGDYHYKTNNNDGPFSESCPVCGADMEKSTKKPSEPSHTCIEPSVLSTAVICCDCGRLYAPNHKSWMTSTSQVYPDWIRRQYQEEWVSYSPSEPCECGCPYFSRVRMQDYSSNDEQPSWY